MKPRPTLKRRRAASNRKPDAKESSVGSALRRALLDRLSDARPFTAKRAHAIEVLAKRAFAVLLEIEPEKTVGAFLRRRSFVHKIPNGAIDVDNGDDNDDSEPMVTSGPAETFGVRAIREFMAMVPTMFPARSSSSESTIELTMAIGNARRLGMTDVAAALEQRLLGRELGGARPVAPSIEDYVAPATPVTSNGLSVTQKNGAS